MFKKSKRSDENMSLLKYVQSDVEACVIQGLLESCGVECILDYDAEVPTSKVIIGNTMLGVNIYVNKDDYEKAKEIMESKASSL